jgi:hypothetical protein
MDVDKLMIQDGSKIYYDPDFRNVLEDHLTFLKTHSTTRNIVMDPQRVYKYESDLFGLLNDYNVPVSLHWLTMRMNDMTSPTDADLSITTLLLPDSSTVDQIRQSHMTTRKVN